MNTAMLKNRLSEKLQNIKPESAEEKIILSENKEERNLIMETTALTAANTGYAALKNNALDIINENLKSQTLSHSLFDVVKSPSGGTTVFTVPGISGDEIEKELTGIILDYATPRAYWETPDPVEGTPPVCFSKNSIISHDRKACSHCEFNTHGSRNGGETNAKACKESVLIYLLRPNNIIPLIVRVPVTSKIAFLKYTTRLVSSLTPISGVVTKITLEKATNKTGQPYALYNFEAVSALNAEDAANSKEFSLKFMDLIKAADAEPISEAV
jgi:hypothetical protein